MKRCSRCHQSKAPTLEHFCKRSHSKDGLDYYCRPCRFLVRLAFRVADGMTFKRHPDAHSAGVTVDDALSDPRQMIPIVTIDRKKLINGCAPLYSSLL